MDRSTELDGVVTSSAMRFGLIIGVVGLFVFAGFEAFSFAVGASWWVKAAWPVFGVVAMIAIWQSRTASIEFDRAGIRARPYPWRPISAQWREVAAFQSRSRGIYAVLVGSRSPVLLLQFGRYRWQVRERQAAFDALERARTLHQL